MRKENCFKVCLKKKKKNLHCKLSKILIIDWVLFSVNWEPIFGNVYYDIKIKSFILWKKILWEEIVSLNSDSTRTADASLAQGIWVLSTLE